jgi:type I restriction enzyme, S subunit
MELRAGYKQTEVGLIPEDWGVKELGGICYPSKTRINPLNSNENYKCVELEHLSQGSAILLGYANSKDLKSQKSVFEKGDVLFGKLRPYLRKFLFADFNGVCTTEIWVLKSEKETSNRFLFHLVQSEKIVEAANLSTGTKMPRAEWKTVSETKIPIPTFTEQAAIANALSDADALIRSLEKLIAKKRNIKQGAMQKLLQPKEGWEVRKLGEVADMYSGGTPLTSISSYYNGNIPWVVIADITKAGKYISETEKTISHEGVSNSSAKLFKKGVLLFAMYASIGKTTIALMDTTCNQAILGIEPKSIDKEYLYYFLSFNERHFITMGQTGTQSNLSKDMVQKLEIPIPKSKVEQTRIATILSDMDAEINTLETKLEKYKKVKLGMMQNLLTGKIRLI